VFDHKKQAVRLCAAMVQYGNFCKMHRATPFNLFSLLFGRLHRDASAGSALRRAAWPGRGALLFGYPLFPAGWFCRYGLATGRAHCDARCSQVKRICLGT